MNLRLSSQSLRFKISETELNSLRKGDTLAMRLDMAVLPVCVRIEPVASGAALVPDLQAGVDQINIKLQVPQGHLQRLMDIGRNRDGLQEVCNGLAVALQVDFRSDSRRSDKPRP